MHDTNVSPLMSLYLAEEYQIVAVLAAPLIFHTFRFAETFREPLMFYTFRIVVTPIPVAARSKAWVYGRSLAGVVGSNPAGGMDVCLL